MYKRQERAQEVVAMGFDAIKFDVDETRAGFRNDRWNWHASNPEINWMVAVSYTHLRAHETVLDLVCRLLLEKKKKYTSNKR